MEYQIYSEVGLVDDNTIIYDESDNSLKNSVCLGDSALCFFIGDFALTIHKKFGKVVGVKCTLDSIKDITFSALSIPQFFDGGVYVNSSMKFIDGVNFAYDFQGGAAYDKQADILLFGSLECDMCVRVCNNLFVAVKGCQIVGVAIKVHLPCFD
jgi:hypothetical protein